MTCQGGHATARMLLGLLHPGQIQLRWWRSSQSVSLAAPSQPNLAGVRARVGTRRHSDHIWPERATSVGYSLDKADSTSRRWYPTSIIFFSTLNVKGRIIPRSPICFDFNVKMLISRPQYIKTPCLYYSKYTNYYDCAVYITNNYMSLNN